MELERFPHSPQFKRNEIAGVVQYPNRLPPYDFLFVPDRSVLQFFLCMYLITWSI